MLFDVIIICLGVIWPAEGMPPIMRFLSNFTPLTHVVEAMRCIVSRGLLDFLGIYLLL
jgi:ABC-type polysaccharide/polyol phosphate export permease